MANGNEVDAFDFCKKNHEHTIDCISNATINTTDLDRVGIHWSDDKSAAKRWVGGKGILLEAYVHNKHTIDRNTDEGKSYAKQHNIYDYNEGAHGPEKEVTVRKGSPVHIMSVEEYRPLSWKPSRLEEFKAPLGGLT